MVITVNGKVVLLENGITVKELLEIQKVEMQDYVTVQVNDEVIEKDKFGSLIIKDGDIVDFLYFMGGGGV